MGGDGLEESHLEFLGLGGQGFGGGFVFATGFEEFQRLAVFMRLCILVIPCRLSDSGGVLVYNNDNGSHRRQEGPMSQTLTISDELYARLEAEARAKQAGSVEQLLDRAYGPTRYISNEELRHRQELGRQADELRERIAAQCGVMPDSTPLVREDRER